MNAPYQNLRRFFPESKEDDLSSYAHRQLIGYVGLVLPVLLWLMAGLRPTTERLPHPWKLLDSISAYYHTPAVSAFAGSLVALSLFFLSYLGYGNEYGPRDRVAAIIAGVAAFLVAVFPGKPPAGAPAFSWWTKPMGTIHYAAAVVLFGSFAFFCLFQFTKTTPEKMDKFRFPGFGLKKEDLGKWARNWIYVCCGVAMAICLVWAAIAKLADTSVFWPETLALEFFAISWLVKGRTDRTVGRLWSALRGKRGVEPAAR